MSSVSRHLMINDYPQTVQHLLYRREWCDAANFIVHNENSLENIFTIPLDKNLYRNQLW